MTIYTRRGDEGRTELRAGQQVSKASPRIESYGTVDELNALIGRVRPTGHVDVDADLAEIQNDLHVIQAELAHPDSADEDPAIQPGDVDRLEGWIDGHEEELEPLRAFILPGGGASGSGLHHARAVCRRAERRVIALDEVEPVSGALIAYLNRLSDLLFVLARLCNARDGVREESPRY